MQQGKRQHAPLATVATSCSGFETAACKLFDRGDTAKIFKALTDDINANGGINGRDVDASVVMYNVLDQANIEATCVKMTEGPSWFAIG